MDTPINFALTGVAGYVAPRHLKALRETGNHLIAALDPFDSVGILDSYFPECEFFTEFERFDRHLEKLRRKNSELAIRYLTVCAPNYLHDAHIRLALRVGADALCEKPLVLNPWNLDALQELEAETGRRVWTILQLRVHPTIVALKSAVESVVESNKKEIELTYITSRGKWYLRSWKGIIEKSGGLASNIGVHFFDMLSWIYGPPENLEVHVRNDTVCAGVLELAQARVRWLLSTDARFIPPQTQAKGQRTFRSILVDGKEIEFSEGFTDLHTEIYRRTVAGQGFGIDDTRQAIEIVSRIRRADLVTASPKTRHSFLNR